jgi:hypothetical protein
MFIITGAAFALGASGYDAGTAGRMGPGYFPLLLGVILALIGIVLVVKAVGHRANSRGEELGTIAWKPLAYVIGANFVFGVLLGGLPAIGLPSFGLIPAIVALVFICTLADGANTFKERLVLAAVLALGSWLVFVKMLNLPFQLWPQFIAG